MLRYLLNILSMVLPPFHFFGFRRWALNFAGVKVYADAKINGHVLIYGRGPIEIGRRAWIGVGCRFYSHEDVLISIGNNCDIAPEVSFIVGSHEIAGSERRAGLGTAKNISIGDGCWLGARVTILGGVTVGSGSIVAAGALVNQNVPENCIVAGVPAKIIKMLN